VALARLTGVAPSPEGKNERFRYSTRGMMDMPVAPNEPRNWQLANDYTGVQAFDLFNIGPVRGMEWILTNRTTGVITVVVDDDQLYTVNARRVGGCRNMKFVRLLVTPVDLVNDYSLWITGIKP